MKKLNLKTIFNQLTNAYKKRRFFYILVMLLLSSLLSIGGVLLGYSGYMSSIDNAFEDKIYQGRNKDVENIILIKVDSKSNCLHNKATYDITKLLSMISNINKPENKPYVIGIQGKLDSEYYSYILENKQSYNNVVFGELLANSDDSVINADNYNIDLIRLFNYNEYPLHYKDYINVGYTNIYSDSDGVIRHYLVNNHNNYKSFAETIYEKYLTETKQEPVNFKIEKNGFTTISFAKSKNYFTSYNYNDVTKDNFDLTIFKDKIVLIGFSDNYLDELYTTPTNKKTLFTNIDIQANTILSFINGNTTILLNKNFQLFVLWLFSTLFIFVVLTCKYSLSLFVGLVSFIASALICDILHSQFHILAHPLYYFVCIIFILLCGAYISLNRLNKLNVKSSLVLNQYMDNVIKDKISDNNSTKRNVAVMFVDIRNFAKLTSDLKSSDVADILNTYFDVIDTNVKNNNGILNKFIGDGALAFWDDVECNGEACFLSCKAAIEISKGIMQVDDYIYHRYRKELSFGIGISFGEAILGDFGSKNRRDFTLVGDVVSTANRLERFATSGNIYISQIVKDATGNRIDATPLPTKVIFKNEYVPVNIYSLNGINEGAIRVIDNRQEIIKSTYNDYVLYFMGCRGSYNVSGKRFNEFGGQTTCMILKTNKHAVIFDCGTGLSGAEDILHDCTKVDVILSHVHYDHCLGLLDWSIFPKGVKPHFYGNFRSWLGLRTINQLFAAPFWPVDPTMGEMHQIPEWGKMLYLGDDITIRFYPSNHPNGAIISHTFANGKNIVNMVDCESANAMPFDVVNKADLLIYDGMFDNSEYGAKIGWGHSTWQEGCELAQRAQVKQLIISHHSPHRSDSELLLLEEYAKNLYPNTVFARANMVIKL